MPPIPPAKQTLAKRAAARELAATPRGGVIGPFVPALRSPEFVTRLQRLGEYLRYRSVLGPRLTELVILLTARAWTQQFEWVLHAAAARASAAAEAAVRVMTRAGVQRSLLVTLAAVLLPWLAASAHHSVLAFDGSHETIITGKVVQLRWQFPHVRFAVVVSQDGRDETWRVESEAPQVLASLGWRPDAVRVGDVVTVRGARAKDGSTALRCSVVELAPERTLRCFAGARAAGGGS